MESSLSVAKSLYDMKFAASLLLLAGYLVHLYLSYRRLSHIPGPWLAGWSNLWLVGTIWRKKSNLEFYEIAQRYGMSYDHVVPSPIPPRRLRLTDGAVRQVRLPGLDQTC
jgi:hypothetical protein